MDADFEDGSPHDWLARAQEDLLISGLLLPHGLNNGVAWHAQQAVEKGLKALLVRAGVAPPKLHDLVVLRHRCAEAGWSMPEEWVSPCRALTPMATVTRYPGWGHVEASEAAQFQRDAEQIVATIQAWLASG
jgi:HEPN domain-containing protein